MWLHSQQGEILRVTISYLELHNYPFLLALNAFNSLKFLQVPLQGDYSPF